ncbi:MAG TPA: hypothetical protein VNS29_15275 [Burkholderiaceae bacterium]|nr:hypothetical protein [Burkholderiaceae bacterium]
MLSQRILSFMRPNVAYSPFEIETKVLAKNVLMLRAALNDLIEAGEIRREGRGHLTAYIRCKDGVAYEGEIVQPRVVDVMSRPAYRPGPEWNRIDERIADFRRIPSRGV